MKQESFYILLLLVYSSVLALSQILYLPMFLPLLLEIGKKRYHFLSIFKKLFLLNFFIFFVALSAYFSSPHLAFLIYLRSNMMVLFALLLFNATSYFDIAYALRNLKVPAKIVSIFYFTAKFIHIFLQDLENFKKNITLRGFSPKVDLFSYKTYANFVGLLFVRAFLRAESLNRILILRGFKGEIYSFKKAQRLSFYDLILIPLTMASLVIKKGVLL